MTAKLAVKPMVHVYWPSRVSRG